VRKRFVLSALLVAVVVMGATGQGTLARLTDQDASTVSFSTDTLAPPTNLTASPVGLTASLMWTPSVDTYAAGYQIWRSTTSGSGYSLVGTATPGTASSATDAAGVGLFYYVLRSYFQNWRSVNSSQTSVAIAVGPVTTPPKPCGASAADTGGDGDGYEVSTASACADDSVMATDVNTGTGARSTACVNVANDRHRFRDFSLGLPGSVTLVSGIQVRADVGMNNNGGTSRLCVELSGDGGLTWTAAKVVTLSSSAEMTYLFGGGADTWGKIWTAGEFSNANFRVRFTDATNQPIKDYQLDYVAVDVTYIP
jgi:predicted ribosomally synthesized peptide with SipW-like signal peptide